MPEKKEAGQNLFFFLVILFVIRGSCLQNRCCRSISVTQYGTLWLFAALNAVLPEAPPAWPPPEVYLGPPWPQLCGWTPAAQAPWRRLWKRPGLREEEEEEGIIMAYFWFSFTFDLLPEWQSAPAAGVCLGLLWLSGCSWTPAGLWACRMLELHPGQQVHSNRGHRYTWKEFHHSDTLNIVATHFFFFFFYKYRHVFNSTLPKVQVTTQWLEHVSRERFNLGSRQAEEKQCARDSNVSVFEKYVVRLITWRGKKLT